MTYLSKHMFDPFGLQEIFNHQPFFAPAFTKKVTIDSNILADKANYSIWELPNGNHEVRVKYSDDNTTYHRASTKQNLEDAEKYVEEQVSYHARRVEGPKLVKSYN